MAPKQRTSKVLLPSRDWALFLDLDGTLLEIAPEPQGVTVPDGLVDDLLAARDYLGGAVAIVSGRTLRDIDTLLHPLNLICAAEHGGELRLGAQAIVATENQRVPDAWREVIRATAQHWPGVVVEYKSHCVAVHYRLAPERERDVLALLDSLVESERDFEVLRARMAFEIRHCDINKGAAVRRIMRNSPFFGRVPVFVGDDITDEDGFQAARELGGMALHVDAVFGGAPANVRRWLHGFVSQGMSDQHDKT